MARQPLYTAQPDTEIPFALRLAQFLLGASDSLGEYNQTLAQQSRVAGDQIEQEERSLDRKSALSLRDKQLQMLDEDRDLARYDRLTAAAEKQAAQQAAAREKAAGQEGLFRLTQLAPKMQEAPPEPAYASDPERLQPNLLRALVKQPRTVPEIVKDAGLTSEMVGQKDVYSALGEFFKGQKPEAPKVQALSKGAKLVDETGRVIAENPEVEKPEKPETPTPERDYHAIAVDELGAGATPAAIARRVRELALKDQERIAGVRADATLSNQIAMLNKRDQVERGQKADEAAAELQQVESILGRLETLIPKVNTPGLMGRIAGVTTRAGEEALQTNPDINEMASLGQGYISVIAKIVQRQSGILSNQDLSRAEKSVPQRGDNFEVASRKMEVLKDILGTAKKNLARLREGGATAPDSPTPTPAVAPAEGARIRVRRKSDGATGTILEQDFDPTKYERL